MNARHEVRAPFDGTVIGAVDVVDAAEIADELGLRLAELAGKLKVGDPTRADTEVGPLIRAGEVKRVGEWVDEAVAAGARLLGGGKALANNCYAPTVLYDPPPDCRVSREEVFGPVVCIYPYGMPAPASTPPRSWSTTTPRFAWTGCRSRACASRGWASGGFPTPSATCRSRRCA